MQKDNQISWLQSIFWIILRLSPAIISGCDQFSHLFVKSADPNLKTVFRIRITARLFSNDQHFVWRASSMKSYFMKRFLWVVCFCLCMSRKLLRGFHSKGTFVTIRILIISNNGQSRLPRCHCTNLSNKLKLVLPINKTIIAMNPNAAICTTCIQCIQNSFMTAFIYSIDSTISVESIE